METILTVLMFGLALFGCYMIYLAMKREELTGKAYTFRRIMVNACASNRIDPMTRIDLLNDIDAVDINELVKAFIHGSDPLELYSTRVRNVVRKHMKECNIEH